MEVSYRWRIESSELSPERNMPMDSWSPSSLVDQRNHGRLRRMTEQ